MFGKLFAKKIKTATHLVVEEAMKDLVPEEQVLEEVLDSAKNNALKDITYNEVEKLLLHMCDSETYEQSEKAIELYAKLLKESTYNRETLIEEVKKIYPKALTGKKHIYSGFVMPKLNSHMIVEHLTNKIIAEIAEMD
tara:strand:+ start:388 stop:801 length:414 start_codon:yes stop_codon:yes gene_type:complete